MPEWEYLVLDREDIVIGSSFGTGLNALGSEGWELVHILPSESETRSGLDAFYFKRLKKD